MGNCISHKPNRRLVDIEMGMVIVVYYFVTWLAHSETLITFLAQKACLLHMLSRVAVKRANFLNSQLVTILLFLCLH